MFITRESCLYPSVRSLLEGAQRTGVYPNDGIPEQISQDECISDRMLYVQSNGRAFIGQDARGCLHFAGIAADRDYPLPTLTMESDQVIGAHPGMYYQADMPVMLSDLHFSVDLLNGTELTSGSGNPKSWYADRFLPVTSTDICGLTLTSSSLAPLLEPGVASAVPGLPLPGPNGAIHMLTVRNNTDAAVKALVRLNLNQSFCTLYQSGYQAMEPSAKRPILAEWDHNIISLWRPEVCALIQAQGFSDAGNAHMPVLKKEITIEPGKEVTLTCYLAIATEHSDLHRALSILYRHSALEWINVAAAFWNERLGRLQAGADDSLQQKSVDFYFRSVLDCFNCYLFDDKGQIVIHNQGAPSHNSGRFWGIDAEPTAFGVLYALPELAYPVVRYVSRRNRPAYSLYRDHSTPIFMAPWIIALHYIRMTGDAGLLSGDAELFERMKADVDELLALRNPDGLVPSRYSSDGHVFRRYDFGTNCKAFYLFDNLPAVLRELGEEGLAAECRRAADKIREGVVKYMTAEGPFGEQFTGGSNMGEHEPFYLKDGFPYYDGEDSASCMAPLYGIVPFTDARWQNYHRFARSLFCTNYDPEMRGLRWFSWGTALDGTALISAIGGAATRELMADGLRNMFSFGVDATGSLFWWPRARNYIRGLTRCTQGEGAWVYQHTRQWLGIDLDARAGTLTIRPQGLYGAYSWKGARIGSGRFNIDYLEAEGNANLTVENLTDQRCTVRFFGRDADAVFSNGDSVEAVLDGGAVAHLSMPFRGTRMMPEPDIPTVESALLSHDGPVLTTYLYKLNSIFDFEPGILVLPYVLLSGEKPLKQAKLTVRAPLSFLIQAKTPGMIDRIQDMNQYVQMDIGDVDPRSRTILPFYLALPEKYKSAEVWMTQAPLSLLKEDAIPYEMILKSKDESQLGMIDATLSWTEDGVERREMCSFPVHALSEAAFGRTCEAIFGGRMVSFVDRL